MVVGDYKLNRLNSTCKKTIIVENLKIGIFLQTLNSVCLFSRVFELSIALPHKRDRSSFRAGIELK